MLTLIVLKELILSAMLRFRDGFCSMFLEIFLTSADSVIRNAIPRSLRRSRGH